MYISFLLYTLFYLPCSVYLLSLTSALRTKKVHAAFPSVLPSLLGLFAFSPKRFKNEEGSCIFPFSCTRFSAFPVRSICFLSRKRFKNEEGSCSISFYLPCSVYLLSLASASRTRRVHVVFPFSCHTLFYLPFYVYFLSPVHAFLPSLFGLFAFFLASALRTRKVHVAFLLPSLFGLFAFSRKRVKNEEGSCSISFLLSHAFLPSLLCIFPFSCTRFSAFPVRSICFLSRKRFKNEEGSCSIPSTFPVRSICFLSQARQERGRFM